MDCGNEFPTQETGLGIPSAPSETAGERLGGLGLPSKPYIIKERHSDSDSQIQTNGTTTF